MLHLKSSLLVGVSVSAFAMLTAPAFAQSANQEAETVIVTGTRVQGMTAADSAAPITVLGTDALQHGTGSTDLRQQLGQSIPSFNAEQYGSDTANLTLSAALRGLSPNDTLVLVNGHRRHYSANLEVDSGGYDAADIGLIPSAAIDHVEVLLDGAAAQYGTDAIAGVVNIILKNKSSGGSLSANVGDYFDRGGSSAGLGNTGEKYDLSYNMGLPLFDKGFANFTIEKRYENYSQFGGADERAVNAANQPVAQQTVTSVGSATGVANLSSGNGLPNTFLPGWVGYPRANPIYGNPEQQLTQGELNAAYDFSDNFELYGFGTIAHRFGKSYENDRLPNQIIATMGSNQPCSASNPNGYDTALTASGSYACAVGLSVSSTGSLVTSGSTVGVTALPNNGINSTTGQVIAQGTGNAGNLFSSTLINAQTGALLPTATGAGTLGSEPELVLYPNGFRPLEVMKEDDYQYNMGMKFNVAGWAVDADVGYGKDISLMYTYNSGVRELFLDTHTTPTNFYDGSFTSSQFTGTIDATHPFNVGLASPLTVAIGAEARQDFYGIGVGDPLSYYASGAQSYPGFAPASAGNHSRKNYAGYVDLAVAPIEQVQLDGAVRYEDYTDFGSVTIGKFTARYDITPEYAIRGTVSTGFRAPTLAEEFYTTVNVSPVSATLQLPADSAEAKLLGLQNLKPEISTSYSLGIVAHPIQDLSATIDAYSISIGNRIASSATVTSAGGAINTPLVSQAIALAGVELDPTATQQGVTSYLNAINTLTQGIDATLSYPTDFDAYGAVNWTLAGNYNVTHVGGFAAPPQVLLQSNPNAFFFNNFNVFSFEHTVPAWKIPLTADWSLDQFGATLRETFYGPRHLYATPNAGGEEIPYNQAGVILTDLEGRYNITDQLQFAIGANNLFNIRPDIYGAAPASCTGGGVILVAGGSCKLGPNQSNGEVQTAGNNQVYQSPLSTNWDPNGGYYYARISYNF